MITDQDVEKMKETFVTKDEFGRLVERVDGIQETLGDLKVEVGEVRERVDSIEVKIDGMIGLLETSLQENRFGAVLIARHDRQIGALASATGVVLLD